MSRRDIIIIAVLINAGLLIVLFASALKSNPEQEATTLAAAPPKEVELPIRKEPAAPSGDEVDQVLREFSKASSSPIVNAPEINAALASAEKKEIKPNFVDDLQAITSPSASLPSAPIAIEPAAHVAEKATPEVIEVKVKKGDVLEKIAKVHHSSVEEIMKYNHLQSTNLKIGQVLKVPQGGKKAASTTTAAAAKAPKYYTVKNGDNPWTIAVKNHIKVEELLKLNNMDAEKARHLKPGDQLRIQ